MSIKQKRITTGRAYSSSITSLVSETFLRQKCLITAHGEREWETITILISSKFVFVLLIILPGLAHYYHNITTRQLVLAFFVAFHSSGLPVIKYESEISKSIGLAGPKPCMQRSIDEKKAKKNSINEMNESEEKHSNENHLLLFKLCMLFAHINCSIILFLVFSLRKQKREPATRKELAARGEEEEEIAALMRFTREGKQQLWGVFFSRGIRR